MTFNPSLQFPHSLPAFLLVFHLTDAKFKVINKLCVLITFLCQLQLTWLEAETQASTDCGRQNGQLPLHGHKRCMERGAPVSLTLQKLRNKWSITASCTVKRLMCGCSIRTHEIQGSASSILKGDAILIPGQRFAEGREGTSGLPLSAVQPHRCRRVSEIPFFTCPSTRQTQAEPHRHSRAPTSFICWPETRKSHRLK